MTGEIKLLFSFYSFPFFCLDTKESKNQDCLKKATKVCLPTKTKTCYSAARCDFGQLVFFLLILTTFALRNFSRGRMGGVWKVGKFESFECCK